MQQKIIKIGNSSGMTLPKTVMEDLNLRVGGMVSLSKNPDKKSYNLSTGGKNTTTSITPHFLKVLERANNTYAQALKELAGK